MTNFELKQFKLANDEEIICEVIEWPQGEEASMVVRKAMKVIIMENYTDGARYYAFRPWLVFQDEIKNNMQILNSYHIVAEANPSVKLKDQYYKFLKELDKQVQLHKDKTIKQLAPKDLDKKVLKELQKDLRELEELIDNGDIEPDSNQNNIIQFDPKNRTLH